MTIAAVSVSGSGTNTIVTDTASATHPVPAEGLAVTLAEALTLPSGVVVGPTGPGQNVTIFQQPPARDVFDIEGSDSLPAGTAESIFSAENH